MKDEKMIHLQMAVAARLEEVRDLFKPELRADYKLTLVARYTGPEAGDRDLMVSDDDSPKAVSDICLRKNWSVQS